MTAAGQAAARPAKSAPQRALEKLGLRRSIDLALHLPLRYEDETRLAPIATLRDGDTAQAEGLVVESTVQLRPRRQLVVRLQDASGELVLRFLHFYPSHRKSLAVGQRVRVRGALRSGYFGLEMVHPAFKVVTGATPLAAALTPVYPTTSQLPQAWLRKAVAAGLERTELHELLPAAVQPAGLPSLREALEFLHHPAPDVALETLEDHEHPAWQRLKFEELLAQQLAQLEARRTRGLQRAPRFRLRAGTLPEQLLAALPFALTAAQRRVGTEIAVDLGAAQADADALQVSDLGAAPGDATSAKPAASPDTIIEPMHRLLQGDVGSGKTVVAALAAALAIANGWQCALMAPTEILVEQHLRRLAGWLEPLGVQVAWLTGSRKGRGRDAALAQIASGAAQLVVGTHAVIQEQVTFQRLGLAIIDEQHRFGVQQRLALRAKLAGAALEPHLLMMSATPIPRTLAMTLYADLDVSTIDELPPGRTPVVTKLFADTRRDAVIERIREAVAQRRQVYWVCPLVEESEHLDLQNATAAHAELRAALPGHSVGLLHGRMSTAEKEAVMRPFAAGALDVLVSTTVIEVGVDVPNASLMVIEHAERFGLSQLHQLRGRVGRGPVASVCVLLYGTPLSATAKERLKAILETADGFEIARRDLEIRGPGEFLGARQSGAALLRFADLATDAHWAERARAAALWLLEHDPAAAARHVERWLGGRSDYLKA